jgi:general secretion pathway protein D
LKHRLVILILLAVTVSGCAAGRAFRRGQDAVRAGDWDAAVAYFTRAVQAEPGKAEYKISLERAMQAASREHIARARELEEKDQLDAALIAYRRAVELDATNRLAAAKAAELERTIRARIEATRAKPEIQKLREQAKLQGAPLLDPTSREPISLTFTNSSLRDVLNTIGNVTGISVTFDQAFVDKAYSVQLDGITLEQALHQVMVANQLFYKVLNPRTIIVVPDTAAKHQQYDELVLRVFYVSHADVAELAQVLNTMLRIPTMAVVPAILPNKTANTITVRGTAPAVEIIERLIRANDKPRAEVVIDVQILEVNRTRTRDLGLNLSSYSLGLTFSPEVAPGAGAPPPFNLNTISQGVSTADFYLTVPTSVVRFLETDSHTKQIAKPQLRGAEGKELTLNLGEDIPILQTVFGAAVPGGFASVPQSSFNYRTVGVNITMTPRVTYEGEIILTLVVDSSTLGPSISVAGQDVPSFGTRKVGTTLRLREGESNLLAGLLRDDQRKILTGFPGIMRAPILRTLFGQTSDEVNQTDIVMLLTPHIVRTHELTADDLAPIFIGTQQNIGLGGPPPLIAPLPVDDQPAAPAPPAAVTQPASPPGVPLPGAQGPPVAAPAGVPPKTPPAPPGTSPVPTLVTPLPPQPAAPGAPAGPPPAAGVPPEPAPPGTPPAAPPPTEKPATPPAGAAPTPPAATVGQVIITSGPEMRLGGGPYTVPLSINNASRVSVLSLTIRFDPNVLRVRTVQDGTFMRQGGVSATFTPRIDAAAGRVDIAVTRTGDRAGASGTGLIAALLFDAVGPGGSMIQVSGVGNDPDGGAVPLQFNQVTVTVR